MANFRYHNESTGEWEDIDTAAIDDGVNRYTATDIKNMSDSMAKFVSVPSSSTSTGTVGNWSADANYLYICYATNTWRRVAIATW